MFWSVVWVFLIGVSFSVPILNAAADFLGFSRGVDLLVYGGIMLLFYMVYRLYAKVDQQQQEITMLVTRIAVNKAMKGKRK